MARAFLASGGMSHRRDIVLLATNSIYDYIFVHKFVKVIHPQGKTAMQTQADYRRNQTNGTTASRPCTRITVQLAETTQKHMQDFHPVKQSNATVSSPNQKKRINDLVVIINRLCEITVMFSFLCLDFVQFEK